MITKMTQSALDPAVEILATKDVDEDSDQYPDPDEEQEEVQH